ncbi:tyrosine-type recombinase/integrase [Streptosporangium canum]|uniref:tyrosine-type recombinase/integrase n=1 Tax=Streptosporangium canum TaxID=324952 RepID=UPI00378F2ECB
MSAPEETTATPAAADFAAATGRAIGPAPSGTGLEALTVGGVILLKKPPAPAPADGGNGDAEDEGIFAELIPLAALPVQLPPKGTPPPAATAAHLATLLRTAGAADRVLAATGGWLLSERRSSPATQAAYVKDVSWWLWWVQARGLDLSDVDFIEADTYAAAMRHADWSTGTRRRRLSALRSWYRYLVRAQAAVRNPLEGMDLPKRNAKITRHLTGAQLDALVTHTLAHESTRTQALVAVLVDTACRVGELIGVQLDDLGYNREDRVLTLPAKGNRDHQVVIGAHTAALIDTYLAERGIAPGPLLVTRTGKPLYRSYVLELLQRLAGAAGIPKPETLSPHSIRHSVATDLLASGLPLHVVQARLGHADPRTTQTYLHDEQLHRSPARHADARLTAALARRHHRIGRDRPLSATGEGDAGSPGDIPSAVGSGLGP